MKKLFSLICLLVIVLACMFYQVYIKKGNQEIEVLNADVSINNIKSMMEIETEINDDYEEIPLGYNNGSIYLIKYDSANKKLYDNNIFILNKDGSSKECGIQLPENYSNCELSIYGDKIFGKDGYFNWQSGKEYKLISSEWGTFNPSWYPISGNSNYYLFVKNNAQNEKYILYNINSNDKYEFECSSASEDVINGIFYDDLSKNFYAMCKNNVLKEIHIDASNFTLEKYDDIKILNKNNIDETNESSNIYSNYIYCLKGQLYISLNYNDKPQNSVDINQYNIADKFTVPLDNITLYGYDNFYKEYILIKKSDDKSSNKIYLAKLEKDGFDMLLEIPKIYGDDSKVSLHMVDSENVLIKEEYHDKENKKIKSKYIVYDLAEYFQENTNKFKSDSSQLTLKNTYKNINDYDSSNKNKLNENEENKNIIEAEQTKSTLKDNSEKDNTLNASATEKSDYREYNSSWRKGNGNWYYYKDNDEKAIGWLKTERGWYYFYKDGVMQKDAIIVENGKEYVLGHDGLLINPDSKLDKDYDVSKEKINTNNNISNNNNGNINTQNNDNTQKNATESNGTKDKQLTNDNNKNSK